jgi:hypothetical protein
VTVPAGKTSASAAARTATSRTTVRRAITAALGRVRKVATLTITPTPKTCDNPALRQASLPSLAYVGDHPTLTVTLTCAAAAPVRVALTSGDGFLPVPSAVTVGKYYASATVPLTPRADEAGQFQATITATRGATALAKTITVDPGISEVAIDPTISYPDQISPEVLTTGIVPAGPDRAPVLKQPGRDRARHLRDPGADLGDGGGVTAKTPVTIEPGLASFTLPATLSTGTTGASGTGTITLAGPVDTATTVYLQSTWGMLTVPGSVTIAAGKDSASFPIGVVPVTTDSPVSIVATLGTSTLQSGNIDVTP